MNKIIVGFGKAIMKIGKKNEQNTVDKVNIWFHEPKVRK